MIDALRPRPYPPAEPFSTAHPWEYISLERLAADVRALVGRLPHDLAGIAGVPRSGLIPAAQLAALLHLPLWQATADGLAPLGHGLRLAVAERRGPLLVLDDSVYSGHALRTVRAALRARHPDLRCLFAALYPRPQALAELDFYARPVPEPHLFEWNLFNCNQARNMACDFDGVLCGDYAGPPDEGIEYEAFLAAAPPRWLPRRSPLPLVVTARLEAHRPATEAWLRRHGVVVERLTMGPWRSPQERRRLYSAGDFKGRAYAASRCRLFVESDPRQAAEIFAVAGKPVLCPATGAIWR